jgi:hypothetical protein
VSIQVQLELPDEPLLAEPALERLLGVWLDEKLLPQITYRIEFGLPDDLLDTRGDLLDRKLALEAELPLELGGRKYRLPMSRPDPS